MSNANATRPAGPVAVPMREIAFLHIGKNAGTQIVHLADQLKDQGVHVSKHPHTTKLCELPPESPYFFSIRSPITRFKSGFYSRRRKGQPRIYAEWSEAEALAFGQFAHANDLAEALFREDETGMRAAQAITAIRHTSMQQIDWFERIGYLDLRPPVWIVRQENLAADFDIFLKRLQLPLAFSDLAPARDAAAHSNDYSQAPALSDLAQLNLLRWYARDVAFYELCVDWMRRQEPGI